MMGKNDVYVQVYLVPPDTPTPEKNAPLPGPNQKTLLPVGELVFPFTLRIPSTGIPSSAEWSGSFASNGGDGGTQSVRYMLKSNINMGTWSKDPSKKRMITVRCHLPFHCAERSTKGNMVGCFPIYALRNVLSVDRCSPPRSPSHPSSPPCSARMLSPRCAPAPRPVLRLHPRGTVLSC